MTKLELLNVFLNDRLTAAAEDIFKAIKSTVEEYQNELLRFKEENERLKRLLNVAVQRMLLQPGRSLELHLITRLLTGSECLFVVFCGVWTLNAAVYFVVFLQQPILSNLRKKTSPQKHMDTRTE